LTQTLKSSSGRPLKKIKMSESLNPNRLAL